MSLKLKRVLAVLVLIALVFGWYVTLFGIGDKTKDDAITSVKSALKYGLDIDGGVYVVMEAKTDLTGDELKKLMEQTRAVLDNRVNQMGVAESSVTIEGNKRLRVEIPGMEDAEDAIKAIGKTAQLYFILADGSVEKFRYTVGTDADVSKTRRLRQMEATTKFCSTLTAKARPCSKKEPARRLTVK